MKLLISKNDPWLKAQKALKLLDGDKAKVNYLISPYHKLVHEKRTKDTKYLSKLKI